MHDIGLIGLAVMGQNLVLNMAEHGFSVAVYNRTASKVDEFIQHKPSSFPIEGFTDIAQFCASLSRPRKILLMVKAGSSVDEVIRQLLPFLEEGDCIIDGGNSLFIDTERRVKDLATQNIIFLGVGISGGEEGARHGPSMMAGGNEAGWPYVRDIFMAISAHVHKEPCCAWLGSGGAGHFVKMVHNGIEYADMELIAEAYDIMLRGLKLSYDRMAQLFEQWNDRKLSSYLIEISGKIFRKKDDLGQYIVEHIVDTAFQKGTGLWTATHGLELGSPVSMIAQAVFARSLSSCSSARTAIHDTFGKEPLAIALTEEQLENGLYAAKILAYTQGFMMLQQASEHYGWQLNLGTCASLWRGGCIIRSRFLEKIADCVFQKTLIVDPFFQQEILHTIDDMRALVASASLAGIPIPCFAAALSWFDGMRSQYLPTNCIQAQRDFFGAHTVQMKGNAEFVHIDWE